MPHRKNPHFEEVSKLATQSTPLPELITWYHREAKLCTLSFLAPPLNEASLHRCLEETSPPATRLNSCNSFNKPDFLSSFYLQEQKLLFLVLQEFTFTQVYVCLESWPAICSTKHVLILIKPLPFLSPPPPKHPLICQDLLPSPCLWIREKFQLHSIPLVTPLPSSSLGLLFLLHLEDVSRSRNGAGNWSSEDDLSSPHTFPSISHSSKSFLAANPVRHRKESEQPEVYLEPGAPLLGGSSSDRCDKKARQLIKTGWNMEECRWGRPKWIQGNKKESRHWWRRNSSGLTGEKWRRNGEQKIKRKEIRTDMMGRARSLQPWNKMYFFGLINIKSDHKSSKHSSNRQKTAFKNNLGVLPQRDTGVTQAERNECAAVKMLTTD